jgi:hypothetical protein
MLVKKYIAYIGVKETSTLARVRVELAGLKHAIEVAKERIANLEQALAIAELQKEELLNAQKEQAESQGEEESGIPTLDSEVEEGSETTGTVS